MNKVIPVKCSTVIPVSADASDDENYFGNVDFNTAYASMLKQIAVKDLTSAKASSISTLFTYAQALRESDPVTAGILMDAIKSNAIYLAGDGASGEVITEEIDATTLK